MPPPIQTVQNMNAARSYKTSNGACQKQHTSTNKTKRKTTQKKATRTYILRARVQTKSKIGTRLATRSGLSNPPIGLPIHNRSLPPYIPHHAIVHIVPQPIIEAYWNKKKKKKEPQRRARDFCPRGNPTLYSPRALCTAKKKEKRSPPRAFSAFEKHNAYV